MSTFFLPASPIKGPQNVDNIRRRARRRGFLIEHHRYSRTWSLIEMQTRLPLSGLDDVTIGAIVHAVENLPPKPVARRKRRSARATHAELPRSPGERGDQTFPEQVRPNGRDQSAATKANGSAPATSADSPTTWSSNLIFAPGSSERRRRGRARSPAGD